MLGEAEVGNLDMSVRAEKNVFRLEITVDNVQRVKVIKSKSDLSSVELGDRVGESLRVSRLLSIRHPHLALSEQAEQLSSCDEIHDHVEVVDILEGAPKVHKERVSDTDEHLPLRVGVLHLLHLDDLLLVEDLDRIETRVVL